MIYPNITSITVDRGYVVQSALLLRNHGRGGQGTTVLRAQVEAVENHMPEVVIVDEIGTEAEALACRSIAERGVQLIGTAHGQILENLMKNPTLSDLIGGIQSVTLGAQPAAGPRAYDYQETTLMPTEADGRPCSR